MTTVNYVGMNERVNPHDADVVEQVNTLIALMIEKDMDTNQIRLWTRRIHFCETLGELEQTDIDLHTTLGM